MREDRLIQQSKPREDYFNSPIFILGLPRSGTSMITGAMEVCGVWLGSLIEDFFENIFLRECVNKPILSYLGVDPLGISKLPSLSDVPVEMLPWVLQGAIRDLMAIKSHNFRRHRINHQIGTGELASLMQEIIDHDGYRHDGPWAYKETKLTLLWPLYKHTFPHARWVIVRRDPQGFIESCLRAPFMNQHSKDVRFWKNVVKEYNARLDALKNSGARVFEISSDELPKGNFKAFKALVGDLGLSYNEKELKKFIDPTLWHS